MSAADMIGSPQIEHVQGGPCLTDPLALAPVLPALRDLRRG